MGCVYIGEDSRKSVHGLLKIGMTQDTKPTRRWSACDLAGLMYVQCPNATKTELLYLESVARLTAERLGFQLSGNDYFHYEIEKGHKLSQASQIANKIATAVCQECQRIGVEFQCYKMPWC